MYSSSLDVGRHLRFESRMIQYGEPFQYHLYCVYIRLCSILLKLLAAPRWEDIFLPCSVPGSLLIIQGLWISILYWLVGVKFLLPGSS